MNRTLSQSPVPRLNYRGSAYKSTSGQGLENFVPPDPLVPSISHRGVLCIYTIPTLPLLLSTYIYKRGYGRVRGYKSGFMGLRRVILTVPLSTTKGGRRGVREWPLPCFLGYGLRNIKHPAFKKTDNSKGPIMKKDWDKARVFRRWQISYGDRVVVRLPGPEYKVGTIVPTRAHYKHTPYGEQNKWEYLRICRETLLGWSPPPFSWLVWFDGEEAPVPFIPKNIRVLLNRGSLSHAI